MLARLLLFLCLGQLEDGVPVGMSATLEELVLPGPELEVAPSDRDTPIVLRIRSASPHGTAWRYDLEYTGLDPGDFDLGDYLQPRQGRARVELPTIGVSIVAGLPEGQVQPHPPAAGSAPVSGGYRGLLVFCGVVWGLGLVVLLVLLRRRTPGPAVEAQRPRTAAELLRPLVERAVAGSLAPGERARLERLLLGFWRRKLGLEVRRPEEALASLRRHAEAGPLLSGLEDWLHRPDRPRELDLELLLEPYRSLPADALELEESRRS